MIKIKKHKSYVLPKYKLCQECKKVMVKIVYDRNCNIPLCKNCRLKDKFNWDEYEKEVV